MKSRPSIGSVVVSAVWCIALLGLVVYDAREGHPYSAGFIAVLAALEAGTLTNKLNERDRA